MRIILLILCASSAALAFVGLAGRYLQPEVSGATAHERGMEAAAHAAAVPASPAAGSAPGFAMADASPDTFAPPLVDRVLTASQRAEPLDGQLRDAMDRIEPVIDPTRLEGPFAPPEFRIWPGTASLVDVFGEHWRLDSPDANVQRRASPIAMGWHRTGGVRCDDYAQNRPRSGAGAALSQLTGPGCKRLGRRDDGSPVPISIAASSLPVFAAPLPGARMSSRDFWAAQRKRMAAMRDRLQHKWRAARNDGSAAPHE